MPEPNLRLREARLKRGWSQGYVAEQIGTEAFTVGRWERGVQPTSLYFQQKLCQLFNMDAAALGFFVKEDVKANEASKDSTTRTVWNVPYVRNSYCTGFESLVTNLRERLETEREGVSLLAISGLGGVGKTQLALEYAYH